MENKNKISFLKFQGIKPTNEAPWTAALTFLTSGTIRRIRTDCTMRRSVPHSREDNVPPEPSIFSGFFFFFLRLLVYVALTWGVEAVGGVETGVDLHLRSKWSEQTSLGGCVKGGISV